MYLAVVLTDALRLVLDAGNGEMYRQDGVGVYKQVKMTVDGFLRLLLRAVCLAEETRPVGNHFLVDAGTCRHHTGGVPLYFYR